MEHVLYLLKVFEASLLCRGAHYTYNLFVHFSFSFFKKNIVLEYQIICTIKPSSANDYSNIFKLVKMCLKGFIEEFHNED